MRRAARQRPGGLVAACREGVGGSGRSGDRIGAGGRVVAEGRVAGAGAGTGSPARGDLAGTREEAAVEAEGASTRRGGEGECQCTLHDHSPVA